MTTQVIYSNTEFITGVLWCECSADDQTILICWYIHLHSVPEKAVIKEFQECVLVLPNTESTENYIEYGGSARNNRDEILIFSQFWE